MACLMAGCVRNFVESRRERGKSTQDNNCSFLKAKLFYNQSETVNQYDLGMFEFNYGFQIFRDYSVRYLVKSKATLKLIPEPKSLYVIFKTGIFLVAKLLYKSKCPSVCMYVCQV